MSDLTEVTVKMSRRDAEFAVAHLRYLADRETARDALHAAANLSTRFVADQIEQAMFNAGSVVGGSGSGKVET